MARTAFALPVKLALSQSTSLLTFTLPILSPILLGGKWTSSCVVLSCLLGLNHTTLEKPPMPSPNSERGEAPP